jgi:hypothetical protein
MRPGIAALIPSILAVTTIGCSVSVKSLAERALGFKSHLNDSRIVDLPTLFCPTSGVKSSKGSDTV